MRGNKYSHFFVNDYNPHNCLNKRAADALIFQVSFLVSRVNFNALSEAAESRQDESSLNPENNEGEFEPPTPLKKPTVYLMHPLVYGYPHQFYNTIPPISWYTIFSRKWNWLCDVLHKTLAAECARQLHYNFHSPHEMSEEKHLHKCDALGS